MSRMGAHVFMELFCVNGKCKQNQFEDRPGYFTHDYSLFVALIIPRFFESRFRFNLRSVQRNGLKDKILS